MIRKILFSVLLVFTVIWFAVAYTLKNNVTNLIKNSESDNIKISYTNIKVTGYPFHWKVLLVEPKVKLIDHINSKEFTSENISLSLDLSAKKATVDLGSYIKEIDHYDDKSSQYLMRSKDVVEDASIKGIIKLVKPLYRVNSNDNVKSIVKSVRLNNKTLTVLQEDKEVFNIKDLAFLISKKSTLEEEDIFLLLSMYYDSENNLLNFKNAILDIATTFKFTQNNKELGTLKDLVIERFIFKCENSSKIDLNGKLQFFANGLPLGKLSFELDNYNNIVDKLLPTNIVFSKKIIKFIIAKAIGKISSDSLIENAELSNNIEKAKFDVEFSEKGINIGSINLLEFKFEDSQEVDSLKE